ncbi:alpha/beta hydrolase [Brucepastera parasyntrophica]|uniref:alpha/beta hydrolase n=1 Tax=Brucepastera parasyntrophica TaxID=2880008 RepID=UPI002109E57A|nr:alpha/beta hydrolase [Brucepastera parasyntrophica]ULQ60498.1 alpha/beta hydrolase [Brucepastera parasyntrophica]
MSISSAGAVNNSITENLSRYNPETIDREKYKNFIAAIQKDHRAAHKGDWQSFLNVTISNCSKYPRFSNEDLRKIVMPFLLIYGSRDPMVKDYEVAKLAENIRDFTVQVIGEEGHFPHAVNRNCNQINRMISEHCSRNHSAI